MKYVMLFLGSFCLGAAVYIYENDKAYASVLLAQGVFMLFLTTIKEE